MSIHDKYVDLSKLNADIEAMERQLEAMRVLRDQLQKAVGGPEIPINRKGGVLDKVVSHLRENGNKPMTMGQLEKKLKVTKTALKQVFYIAHKDVFDREHEGKIVRFSLKM